MKSPMPAPSLHLKIKIPMTVTRGISKRSHERIGNCEQSRELLSIYSAMNGPLLLRTFVCNVFLCTCDGNPK